MSSLDALDRNILYHLQQDATQPITDIADALDVADNTVRNRIQRLEETGAITGYSVDVDYDRAGIQHYYLFVCSVRVGGRETVAPAAEEIPGVLEVTSVMTGRQNVLVEAAAPTKGEITDIALAIDDCGLDVDREHLIWSQTKKPYSGFRTRDML